jgi:hypothetical protein
MAKSKSVEPVAEPAEPEVKVAPKSEPAPVAAEPEFVAYTPVQPVAPEVKHVPETKSVPEAKSVKDAFDDYDDVITFITRKR